MIEPIPGAGTAANLRAAFDRARALPFVTEAGERSEDLLAIRVSGDAFAIRLGEVSGLAIDRKVVAFPSPLPELLGISAIRGRLVPVYSLAALLGYSAEARQARWLALCDVEEPVGLSIGDFEGHIRVPASNVYAASQGAETAARIKYVVRSADTVREIVSIPIIIAMIQRRCRLDSEPEER